MFRKMKLVCIFGSILTTNILSQTNLSSIDSKVSYVLQKSGKQSVRRICPRLPHVFDSRSTVFESEPVVFKLGLSHPTQPASEWQGGLLYVSTKTSLIATNSSGQEFRLEGDHFILSSVIQNTAAAMANRDIEFKFPLDLDTVHRIFPKPGSYNVRVVHTYYPDALYGVATELISDPVRVNIQEPTGINGMAYNYYQTFVKPVLSSRIEREALEARREFSRRFGESVYAKYNSFELARLFERAGDFQLAEDELYPISDVDFYYRDYINQALNRLAGKLRRPPVRTKFHPQIGTVPKGVWVERPDIRPNYNIAPIPAPILVPNPDCNTPNSVAIRRSRKGRFQK